MSGREDQFRSAAEPFQHLEDREVVLWGLTFTQLIYAVIGVIIAGIFVIYVSPLSPPQTLFVAIIIAGVPPMLSWAATEGDIAPWTMTWALVRWVRSPRQFAPGGSQTTDGYLIEGREQVLLGEATAPHSTEALEEIWQR